ncbi:MAG: rhodanese-like domain-containing protein [Mycobacteriales bacterium]
MNQPTQVTDISPQDAARRAAAGEVLLLDVREDYEWAAGHAADATHTALGTLNPAGVPRDRPVVAVCRSGGRSGKAAEALAVAGHEVSNMVGGMNAWASAGLPVVGAEGKPGQVI